MLNAEPSSKFVGASLSGTIISVVLLPTFALLAQPEVQHYHRPIGIYLSKPYPRAVLLTLGQQSRKVFVGNTTGYQTLTRSSDD